MSFYLIPPLPLQTSLFLNISPSQTEIRNDKWKFIKSTETWVKIRKLEKLSSLIYNSSISFHYPSSTSIYTRTLLVNLGAPLIWINAHLNLFSCISEIKNTSYELIQRNQSSTFHFTLVWRASDHFTLVWRASDHFYFSLTCFRSFLL